MKIFVGLIILLLISCSNYVHVLKSDQYEQKNTIVFRNVNVIPMTSDTVLKNQTVIIEDGVIKKISSVNESTEGQFIIDGTGKYLMPGLGDMHAHPKNELDFLLYLSNGVTTLRSARGSGFDIELREMIKRKEIIGPNYYVSSPFITWYNTWFTWMATWKLKGYKDDGYDYLKIHTDLREGLYSHIIEKAKDLEMPVIGHAQREADWKYTLQLKSVTHMEEFLHLMIRHVPWEKRPEYFTHSTREQRFVHYDSLKYGQRVKNSDIYICPTLSIMKVIPDYLTPKRMAELEGRSEMKFLSESYKDDWDADDNTYVSRFGYESVGGHSYDYYLLEEYLMYFKKHNIPMILGTDAFGYVIPGFSVHDELQLMVKAGLSSYEALQIGTINIAKYLDKEKTEGSIEQGKKADLILLNANPLDDISNSSKIQGVLKETFWFDRSKIDSLKNTFLKHLE